MDQLASIESTERLLSYDSSTVLAELEDESSLLSGRFADEYAQLVRETIAPAAEAGRVDTKATVVSAGVVRSADDTVTVLQFLNVTSTNRAEGSRTTRSRLHVEMTFVDGGGASLEWIRSESAHIRWVR